MEDLPVCILAEHADPDVFCAGRRSAAVVVDGPEERSPSESAAVKTRRNRVPQTRAAMAFALVSSTHCDKIRLPGPQIRTLDHQGLTSLVDTVNGST